MIDVLGHQIWQGDALAVLKTIPDNSYGACCTDPPYHLTNLQPDTVGCVRCGNWGERKGQYGDARPGDPCPKCATPMIRRRSGHEDRNPARGYPQRNDATGEWDKGGRDDTKIASGGGFMGMHWDGGDIAFNVDLWREVYRVLKPGAFLVAFSATRTYHRMASAIEDAGFVVREMLHWAYGSGFPKRHDISKAFDKANGARRGKTKIVGAHNNKGSADTRPYIERAKEIGYHEIDDNTPISPEAIAWQGWDIALKPGHEPICLAQKPREGTYTENIRAWGVGALNIDKCRIPTAETLHKPGPAGGIKGDAWREMENRPVARDGGFDFDQSPAGRYPPNQLMTHSLFCTPAGCDPSCPIGRMDKQSGTSKAGVAKAIRGKRGQGETLPGGGKGDSLPNGPQHGDEGGASRYFPTLDYEDQDFWWFDYTAKPAKKEKTAGTIDPDTGESSQTHVTVKPLSVMGWLLDLILPKGERAIDIFAGSGTTLCAAHQRRHLCDGIELLPEHVAIITDRLNANTIKGWE